MSIADAVEALADGINGCALGRGADATDALHVYRSVDQGSTAARGRLAHLICSSKSLWWEKRSMAKGSTPQKNRGWPGFCSDLHRRFNAQAFEGLVVSAADMAEARSMHPATARKPMYWGGGNDVSIIPTAGVSFCCCWHGIRKNLAFGRSRPCSEASSGGQDTRSTAISPCCASTPPSSARCAWSTLHSEITASTAPRRSPSNATARLSL